LWKSKYKGHTPKSSKAAPTDRAALYVRAIFAAHNQTLLINKILEIAADKFPEKNITYKSVHAFLWLRKELFNVYPGHNKYKFYGPNGVFFKRYVNEVEHYKKLFPEKAVLISDRFARAKKNGCDQGGPDIIQGGPDIIDDVELTRATVVRAILAAYEKPLTYKNISRLAARFGYEVKVSYLYAFRNTYAKFLDRVDKGMKALFIKANDQFFKEYAHEIEYYVDLLKNRKEQIYSRFNAHVPELAKAHEKAHHEDFDDDQAPAEDKAAEVVEDIEQEVSAADVGASIIAYVDKLKTALKKRQAVDVVMRDEKEHIKALNDKIISLKNERTNLTTQNEKQAAIIKSKDKSLSNLESELALKANQISKLEIKLERAVAGRSTFKMSEVANISSLLKSSEKRSLNEGQEK
jgi:hypothetical protein